MSDNGMTTLRCGVEDHGDMDRLLEDHQPLTAAFSLWICQGCGTMAVHLEVPGDIYWYNAQAKTRSSDEPGAARVSLIGPVFGHPIGDGERADEARQQKAYEARVDAYDRRRDDDDDARPA